MASLPVRVESVLVQAHILAVTASFFMDWQGIFSPSKFANYGYLIVLANIDIWHFPRKR